MSYLVCVEYPLRSFAFDEKLSDLKHINKKNEAILI